MSDLKLLSRRLFIAMVTVGMVSQGQLSVLFFYILGSCCLLQLKNLIMTPHRFGRHVQSTTKMSKIKTSSLNLRTFQKAANCANRMNKCEYIIIQRSMQFAPGPSTYCTRLSGGQASVQRHTRISLQKCKAGPDDRHAVA